MNDHSESWREMLGECAGDVLAFVCSKEDHEYLADLFRLAYRRGGIAALREACGEKMTSHPNRKIKTYRVHANTGTYSARINIRASCAVNAEARAWKLLVDDNSTESHMVTRGGREDCRLEAVEIGQDGTPVA